MVAYNPAERGLRGGYGGADDDAIAALDPDAIFNRAIASLREQSESAALEEVAKALTRFPDHGRLWLASGLLHRALDELAPAVHAFDKAAGLLSSDVAIAHGRARVHLDAGLPATALFDEAIRLGPQRDALRLDRITAILAESGVAAAIAELDKELATTPSWPAGQAEAARLRWMSGDIDGFTANVEKELERSPHDVSLWRELLVALMHASHNLALLEAVRRGRAALGPHPIFDASEAVALDELGELERARKLYAGLGTVTDPVLAVFHVRHLLRAGEVEAAAALGERWTRAPQAVLFWPYVSAAWRVLGDSRSAWLDGDPRLVGVYDLGDRLDLDALAARLRSLHFASWQPLDQSLRGGTQTKGPLLARMEPEIRQLRAAVVDAVERHVAQLPPHDPAHPTLSRRRDRPIRFSGSWSVRLSDEGFHVNHVHPGGWFSSALYVALPSPEESGPAPAGWLALGEPPAELGLGLGPTRLVEPRPGRLALFPSTMWHGTRPFSRGERLTLAFDVATPPH